MSRTEQVILTNMCMITDGRRVLVQDRKSEKWPGVTFPGGPCRMWREYYFLRHSRNQGRNGFDGI